MRFIQRKLFVTNLPYATTDLDLVQLFSAAGKVADVHLFGSQSGRAVVRMVDEAGYEAALTFDRTCYGGRTLRCTEWIDKEMRPWHPLSRGPSRE